MVEFLLSLSISISLQIGITLTNSDSIKSLDTNSSNIVIVPDVDPYE